MSRIFHRKHLTGFRHDLNIPYVGDYRDNNNWEEKYWDIYEKKIKERKRNEAIESKAIEAYIKAGQP